MTDPDAAPRDSNEIVNWALAALALTMIYLVVFVLAGDIREPGKLVVRALCNAVPHIVLAIPLLDRTAPWLRGMVPRRAFASAGVAVLLYAAVAYGAVVFLLALTGSTRSDGILVRFFSGPALPWQLMQGASYGLAAIGLGLWRDTERALLTARATMNGPVSPRPPARWLVKTADGIIPVAPEEILHIEAAGEYSRLVLENRSLMSRTGMGQCARRLAEHPFLQVHRSHLVSSEAIVRAEPAGNGRIQLTLRNGDQIVTSREGARLVRANAI